MFEPKVELIPAEVAAKIRRPAALVAAIGHWNSLRTRNRELAEELGKLYGERSGVSGSPNADTGKLREIDDVIARLATEKDGLAARVRPALAAVTAARMPYTAAVALALDPLRQQAAARALAAIHELRAALATIDEC